MCAGKGLLRQLLNGLEPQAFALEPQHAENLFYMLLGIPAASAAPNRRVNQRTLDIIPDSPAADPCLRGDLAY
jgi:hypothetical protein